MEDKTKHLLTVFYFFSLGLWTTIIPMVIVWVAIEDILAGSLLSTTVLIISFSVPDIISKIFSPYLVNRISFQWSFALLTLLFVGSLIVIVVGKDIETRIIGVSIHGLANGFAVITCVRMIAYYNQAHVLANAYQNGTNASVFVASLAYTGQ